MSNQVTCPSQCQTGHNRCLRVCASQAGGDVEAAKRREEELQRELQAQRDAVVRTQDELNSFKTSFEASMGATDEGKVLLKLKEIDDMVRTL